MVRFLLSSLLCLTFLLGNNSFSWADCADDPRDCFGEFDEEDNLPTESGAAERTFALPPLKAGFIVDLYKRDILPHISVGLWSFSAPLGYISLDAGVATSRVFINVVWEVIPIVRIGPCVWGGYNVKENTPAFGIGLSMLNF